MNANKNVAFYTQVGYCWCHSYLLRNERQGSHWSSISVQVMESPACCNIATTVNHSKWSVVILQLLCNRLTCLLRYCHHCVVTNKKHHSWQHTLSQLLNGCSNKHSWKQKQDSTSIFLVITVPKLIIT